MTKKKLPYVVLALCFIGVWALWFMHDANSGGQKSSEFFSDKGTPCALKGSFTVSENDSRDLLNGQIGLRDSVGHCKVQADLSDFNFETDGIIAVSQEGNKFFLTADISSHSKGVKMFNILTIRHKGKSSNLTVVTQNGPSH